MKQNKFVRTFIVILCCWICFVEFEGFRLIGSTDPGKYPLLTVSTTQIQDELADYNSLGFSQEYYLTTGDRVIYGEFKVLGIRLARWEI